MTTEERVNAIAKQAQAQHNPDGTDLFSLFVRHSAKGVAQHVAIRPLVLAKAAWEHRYERLPEATKQKILEAAELLRGLEGV